MYVVEVSLKLYLMLFFEQPQILLKFFDLHPTWFHRYLILVNQLNHGKKGLHLAFSILSMLMTNSVKSSVFSKGVFLIYFFQKTILIDCKYILSNHL